MKVTQQFNCSQVDFDNAKSRDNISLTCKICNKIYYKNKKNILGKFKTRSTFPMFCSNACQGNFRTQSSTKEIKCTNCNKNFRKKTATFLKPKITSAITLAQLFIIIKTNLMEQEDPSLKSNSKITYSKNFLP